MARLALGALGLLVPTAAAVQNPHGAQVVPVKADTTKKPEPAVPVVAPPGCEVYQAQRGDSLPSVARKYLRKTKYLTSAELADGFGMFNMRQMIFFEDGMPVMLLLLGCSIGAAGSFFALRRQL